MEEADDTPTISVLAIGGGGTTDIIVGLRHGNTVRNVMRNGRSGNAVQSNSLLYRWR
jgi:hypothetical protein